MPVSHTISFVKAVMGHVLRPGDWAVDATCGNGIDTVFLSRAVGPTGRVFALDIQPGAIESTRGRLRREAAPDNVTLIQAGHEHMAGLLPPDAAGRVRAVMFNLGYLPGGDQGVITRPETTVAALDAALGLLAPGGLASLAVYTGHPGGADEAHALERHTASLSPDLARVMLCTMHNHPGSQVRLLLLERL